MQPAGRQLSNQSSALKASVKSDSVNELAGQLSEVSVAGEPEPKLAAPSCCMRAPNSNLLHALEPTQFRNQQVAHEALFAAAKNNNVDDLLDALHYPFIDINRLDEDNKTPLYYAVVNRNVAAVRILRQHGAVDATGGFGRLTYLIDSGQRDLDDRYEEIKHILTLPVEEAPINSEFDRVDPSDCDVLDHLENTALHENVRSDDVEAAIAVCDNSNRQGADLREMVNKQNAQGDTPLHLAMKVDDQRKRIKICTALLARGANPGMLNNEKLKPYNLTSNFEVLELLAEEGGCDEAAYKLKKLKKQADIDNRNTQRANQDKKDRDQDRARRFIYNQYYEGGIYGAGL